GCPRPTSGIRLPRRGIMRRVQAPTRRARERSRSTETFQPGRRWVSARIVLSEVETSRRGRYTVKAIGLADGGRAYAVASPAGDALYTFSDKHSALEEAALLNKSPAALSPRARRPPLRQAGRR